MSTPTSRPGPPGPRINVRGAIDLAPLAARRPAGDAGANGGSGAGGLGGAGGVGATAGSAHGSGAFVLAVSEADFVAEVVERSATVPVIIDFWAEWCQPCKQLTPVLEKLAAEHNGAFLLATVDTDANQQLAQMFQVQSIPTVFAVVARQPIPLFQGAQPEAQVRRVITEVLRLAAENGVTGRLDPVGAAPVAGEDGEGDGEPVEEPLPPLHQKAYDAIEAGDLDGAIAAYQQAVKESPSDDEARLGLAQVSLMKRTADVDVPAARAAAAADAADVDAQLRVADIDVLGGQVGDAFARLVDTVRLTSGAERDRVRARLLEFFELIGTDDARVATARLALANALF